MELLSGGFCGGFRDHSFGLAGASLLLFTFAALLVEALLCGELCLARDVSHIYHYKRAIAKRVLENQGGKAYRIPLGVTTLLCESSSRIPSRGFSVSLTPFREALLHSAVFLLRTHHSLTPCYCKLV